MGLRERCKLPQRVWLQSGCQTLSAAFSVLKNLHLKTGVVDFGEKVANYLFGETVLCSKISLFLGNYMAKLHYYYI